MDEQIVQGLKSQFEKHRIVFWYDSKKDMREQFDILEMSGIEKIEIDNNEFSIKYKILRENPDKKFLIYNFGPEPERLIDNWLLDVKLSHGQFSADKIQIWLDQLGLDYQFSDLIKQHEYFFRSSKRLEDLKFQLEEKDDQISIKDKMLFVISNTKQDIEGIIATLFTDLQKQEENHIRLMRKCNLEDYFWQLLERRYGYQSENKGVKDFALLLFKSCYEGTKGHDFILNQDAEILLKRWKNDKKNHEIFEYLSREFQDMLRITDDLIKTDFRTFIEIDYFEAIDRHIIKSLVSELSSQTIPQKEVISIYRARRNSHWFSEKYKHVYETIKFASYFLNEMAEIKLGINDFEEGLNNYTKTFYKIDQLYRKFIYHLRKSSQTATLLAKISELIENKYSNEFLLNLNDAWQKLLNPLNEWKSSTILSQTDFFQEYVQKLRKKQIKCVVIISDALRYEIGEELQRKIKQIDKFETTIDPLLASIPSYTQLGMASLLPNGNLGFSDISKASVTLNDLPTDGIENRKKILDKFTDQDKTSASHSSKFMNFTHDEVRKIFSENDILYIYHNQIDAIGDMSKTEDRVFETVEETIKELSDLVKKLTSANVSHVFITSDHGFIYQNKEIDESDYLSAKPEGKEILYSDRRFILGSKLIENESFKKFKSEDLNISGDFEILFPKSINRLRKRGSGSRYVHGGMSLQEIIVPVIKIYKGRKSDSQPVEITILKGSTTTISTSQISLTLYQESPISEKVFARTLRIGLFGSDGKSISNVLDLPFDFESQDPRDREQKIQLILSKESDNYDNQDVFLILKEQLDGTSHFEEYKKVKYFIKRSIKNDFDF